MLSRLIRVQVDSTDEIVKEFNVLIDNCNLMETKLCQLSHEVEALKPKVVPKLEDLPLPKAKKPKIKLPKKEKKKGRTMKKKGIAITRVLAILMLVVAIGYTGVAYAQYRPTDITYDIVSNPTMLTTYLRDVTLNMASDSYLFNPRAAAPQAALGRIYYNSGANEWVGYNGAWTTFAVAAGGSLNAAYGVGDTITADDGQVVINTTDADANPSLAINHSGGAAGDGLLVTVSGAFNKDAIEIENTANGYDIEGTGATWFVTKGGALTVTALDSTGATGITLENDETITNADGDITFTDSGTGEDFSIDLNAGGNVVTFKSATGIDELAFGAVDDLSGVATIVFDDAATSAISMTGTGTNNLTITQLGVGNESLVLNSDGNPVDAVTIAATAGGIDVDSALSIVLTSTENQPDSIVIQSTLGGIDIVADASGGEDINITNTGGSIVASASQIATDAITIVGTAGGIDMDAVDDINIAVASTAAADDLALVQTGGVNASITLAAAGTGADAIDLNASAGGIDIDAALGVTIDNAGAASNIAIASAAGSLNLAGGEAALDAVTITSGGGIDIDAVDDVDFILTAGAAGEDFTIQCTGVQDTTLSLLSSGTAANAIEIITSAGGIDITNVGSAAGEDVDISSNRAVNVTSSEATDLAILIQTSNVAGNIRVQSADNTADALDINTTAGGIDIDAALGITINNAGAASDITIDSALGSVNIIGGQAATDAVNIDATGANGGVDIDTTNGPIVMTTAGAANGDILIDASDNITLISTDADAAGVTIQTDGGAAETIYINSTAGTSASAIYLDADVGGITLLADGAVNGDILIDAEDKITIVSYDQDAAGIDIGVPATGHANSTIHVHNETGTGAAAIALQADVGGITLLSNGDAAGDILIDAEDSITLVSTDDHAAAIDISVGVGAAASTIIVTNTSGTAVSLAAAETAAIQLYADAGGIGLNSGLNGANAIRIEADGGAGEIIMVHSNQGTGVAATGEVDASVQIMSDDGGIGLYTTSNLGDAIRIEANGGINEFITISSVQGTGQDSITLNSVLGGIAVTANAAAADIDINSILGSVILLAEETGAARAMSIVADGDATTGVWIQSVSGTSVTEDTAALEIQATAGGIHIKSDANLDDAIVIRADGGGTAEMTITNDQGTTADSIEIASAAGGVTISGGADDSITMTTGAAGGAAGNVIFTNGQTRAHYIQVSDVDLDGTNPPTLTSNGTDARWRSASLEFDADPGGNDDVCYIQWVVPAGYIADTADLHVYWSFDTAEDAADECVIDGTVSAIAAGEDLDVAGTVMAAVTSVITDASAEEGSLVKTSLDIEVEDIVVDDLVTIMFFFDESACLMANSGTADVHYFVITYESSE